VSYAVFLLLIGEGTALLLHGIDVHWDRTIIGSGADRGGPWSEARPLERSLHVGINPFSNLDCLYEGLGFLHIHLLTGTRFETSDVPVELLSLRHVGDDVSQLSEPTGIVPNRADLSQVGYTVSCYLDGVYGAKVVP